MRKELRQGLREIHDTTGLTTVFVTHDQDEAMELADLVVVMSMGRIEQIGSPHDIRARPATAVRARLHHDLDKAPGEPMRPGKGRDRDRDQNALVTPAAAGRYP